MFNKLIILIGILSASASKADQFIVWNTGQGQWTSEVHSNFCIHFDLGGEKDVSSQVLKVCHGKANFLHLSHWDWDHISFANRFAALAKKSCLMSMPVGLASLRKTKLIGQIPLCTSTELQIVSTETRKIFSPQPKKTPSAKQDANSLSEVMYSETFKILIPGDSPRSQENFWAENSPVKTRGLVLGHHGSRTSTSQFLMNRLSGLQWAVASARFHRYGHPHRQVVEILKKEKVPLLKTEDWGHLHFLKP